MLQLFIHQWKENIRSSIWQKKILVNIIFSLAGLYIFTNIFFLGLFADKVILQIDDSSDVVKTFTSLLFYYFLFDLIFRFLFQKLPTITIKPYLILPVKKSKLFHYLLVRTIPNFFNIVAALLFIPFFIKNIYPNYSINFCLGWIITVFALVVSNNFLSFWLKMTFVNKPLFIILLIALAGILLYIDIDNVVSFSSLFSSCIYYISNNLAIATTPVLMGLFSYFLGYSTLKKNVYLEDLQNIGLKKGMGFSFFNQYGEIGQLIGIELKLIWRNRRPKTLLFFSLFFMLYGFMFYKKENMENDALLIFIGLFLTSLFSMNYSQFFFSWESSFFNSYLINKISTANYIKSKYFIFLIGSVLSFLISLPYSWINYKIGFINATFFLYNVGISSIIILFSSTFNSSYISLDRSSFMNYEGFSFRQFLISVPILGLPFLIYFLFKSLDIFQFYYYAMAIMGVLAIVLHKYFLKSIEDQFKKRKYDMVLGFKQK